MKLLSIIVPIFKVETYLERCLRSLVRQDIPSEMYEIICINDGSPDNSSNIVKKMQSEISNIVLIEQSNQGVSKARNKGIDFATGKYILMIDPDDYVIHDTFSAILKYVEDMDAEVAFLGFRTLSEDGSTIRDTLNEMEKGRIFKGITASELARGDGQIDPDRMWAVLFRLDLFTRNESYFLPNVPYLEDGELMARILCLAERCAFWGDLFYIRTTRPKSATRSDLFYSKNATDGFLKAAVNLRDFRESHSLNADQKGYMNKKIIKFITLTVASVLKLKAISRFCYVKAQIQNNNLDKVDLQGVSESYYHYGEKINRSVNYLLRYLFWLQIKSRIIRPLSGSSVNRLNG